MRKVQRFAVCAAVIFSVAVCLTLVGAQEAPVRGPEHDRLAYFVGNWTNEGEIKENPMGMPAGKFSGKDRCDWFEGKFAVVCNNSGTGPMGSNTGMGIISYSSMEGIYTYYGTDSTGMAMTTIPRGRVDGKNWVYDDESKMGDKMVKNRYSMVELSATSYTFKWEVEGPDGWTTVMQGTAKKG